MLIYIFKFMACAIVAVGLDVLFGFSCAIVRGMGNPAEGLDSSVMRKGGARKVVIIMAIFLFFLIDLMIRWLAITDFIVTLLGEYKDILVYSGYISITIPMCIYIIAMELISILETVDNTEPNFLPEWVKNIMKKVKKAMKIENDDSEEHKQ